MKTSQLVKTVEIKPSQLKVEPGFNIRDGGFSSYFELPDVRNHIESICSAYKNGRHVDPIVVEIVDGDFLIRQGHCRHKALLKAISQGADIELITVIVLNGSDDEMYLQNISGNSGLKLNIVAMGLGCNESIVRFGYTKHDLAVRLNKSITAINNFLNVHNLPNELKEMIIRNEVSYTFCLKMYAEHKDGALKIIKDALDKKLSCNSGSTSKVDGFAGDGKAEEKNNRKIAKLTDKDITKKRQPLNKKVLAKRFLDFADYLGVNDELSIPDAGLTVTIEKATLLELIELRKELSS